MFILAPPLFAGHAVSSDGPDLINLGVNALHIQYATDESEGIPSGTGSSAFFVRRAEFYAKGQLNQGIAYEVEYDLAPEKALLRSAYIDFMGDQEGILGSSLGASLRLGQFRIPFGIEIQTSSKRLLFINRMLITNPNNEQESSKGITSVTSGFIQDRDIGIRVSGKAASVSYAMAVVNGSDKNVPDKNSAKDVIARLVAQPFNGLTLGGLTLGGVTLGSSAYRGNGPTQNARRDRVGSDVEFQQGESLLIRGELVTGKDGAVKFDGYYAFLAYRVLPNVEPAIRHEWLDPDIGVSGNEIRRTTVGVNYYMAGNTKYQINYEWRKDSAKPNLDNMALVQLQISF